MKLPVKPPVDPWGHVILAFVLLPVVLMAFLEPSLVLGRLVL